MGVLALIAEQVCLWSHLPAATRHCDGFDVIGSRQPRDIDRLLHGQHQAANANSVARGSYRPKYLAGPGPSSSLPLPSVFPLEVGPLKYS